MKRSKIGPFLPNRTVWSQSNRPRAARPRRKPFANRCSPRVEQLEDRVTPSINPLTPLELDANVVTTTAHDWDQVFNDVVNGTSTSGAIAVSFVTDAVNTTGDDIFTGGGSKDTLGIQQGQWLFTDSKPQAKDDITHAYAAMYTDPSNGHTILYAGLDRYDNSGDATAGFWFFRNAIRADRSAGERFRPRLWPGTARVVTP